MLFSQEDVVLVDCGYPGFLELIEDEMRKNGVDPARLTKLLLTHQDDDHMGAAFELVEKYPHIQIAASKIEAPYISGQKKNMRLEQAEQLQEHLPEEEKAFGLQFCQQLRRVKPVQVDFEVKDGDCFAWGGGCQIIATPGHISVYLPKDRVLITGDAAVAEDGRLNIANPQFCFELDQAKASLDKIEEIACKQYICYHGGVLASEKLAN